MNTISTELFQHAQKYFSKITFASLWALTMRIAIHSLDEDESKQTLTNYTAGISHLCSKSGLHDQI